MVGSQCTTRAMLRGEVVFPEASGLQHQLTPGWNLTASPCSSELFNKDASCEYAAPVTGQHELHWKQFLPLRGLLRLANTFLERALIMGLRDLESSQLLLFPFSASWFSYP